MSDPSTMALREPRGSGARAQGAQNVETRAMKLSVVIPCYRSESTLPAVVEETIRVLQQREATDYEIILVDDGSPDRTLDAIRSLCRNPKIKGIGLAKNFGQPCATLAGLSAVTGDDDGQTPIDHLWPLVDQLAQGSDVVFATFPAHTQTALQRVGRVLNDLMASYLIGKPKHLHFGNFWVCRRYIADEAVKFKNPYPYLGGVFVRTTRHMSEVRTSPRPRLSGRSSYSMRKMVSLWLNGFTAFSIVPLRLATGLGVVIAAIGFLFALEISVVRLMNPAIPAGYSSIMASLLLMGGLIVSLLGVVGEYVGRIYMNINGIPQYVVRESLNIDAHPRSGGLS
jgi:undecaprenyl-phosphate 4-deoxy-4-formamido-L-arabinose transferase